jgi:hypothetical protein
MSLLGREAELQALRAFLSREGPGLAVVAGPRGTGKTALLAAALPEQEAVHFQALPLPPEDLLGDLERAIRARLGRLPGPRHPGLLPLPTPDAHWEALLTGLVDRAEEGRPFVLALDGAEAFLGAHRKWGSRLSEAVARARDRAAPLKVVVAGRRRDALRAALERPEGAALPDAELELGPLPFRIAGWGHGARSARDAFLLWALFGDHPAHLPARRLLPDGPAGGLEATAIEEQVVSRVLRSSGDLFDVPVRLIEAAFQRPARYLALLRTLADGPLDWARTLERTTGIASGGQLAPYLRKLEEEGLVQVEKPLDAAEESRNRRYRLTDPFLAFWCGLVLPYRSLLSTHGPETVWRERIRPCLPDHLNRWLVQAARRWLRHHAEERLPAPARVVGGLWGEEADFDVVGWLENGQVCYGLARWTDAAVPGDAVHREMADRMRETRYGIGREARAPLYFLPGGAGEGLRRQVARDPLSRILGLDELMGNGPPRIS